MRREIALAMFLCLGAATPVPAQTVLTLTDAIAAAHRANPGLQQARAVLEGVEADSAVARAARLPVVSFSESWQRGTSPLFAFGALLGARRFQTSDFAVDRLNHPGVTASFGSRIMVTQTLFDAGLTRATVAAARGARDISAAEMDAAAVSVAVDVVRAYARLASAEAAARAAASAIASTEETQRRAERRRDAGTATEADVLAVAVHLAHARQLAVEAAGDAAIARARLNQLTGSPIDRIFTIVVPPAPPAAGVDVTTLLREAEAARPEVRRAIAAAELATQQSRAARAAWAPRIQGHAGYEASGLRAGERAGAWLAGAEITWSLSAGGAEIARSRAAAARARAAQSGLESARAAVRTDVITAVQQVATARARAASAEGTLVAAREAHRILRNRYDNGMAGIWDVLQAASVETDAERARVDALVGLVVADAELRRAVGRPIE